MAMTGAGGWPLSVFLTPDLEPFFGGTYFPPDDRYGRPGFVSVLLTIAQHWQADEKKIRAAGRDLADAIRSQTAGAAAERTALDRRCLDAASAELARRFDPRYAGFGAAPKFPGSHVLSMLLVHGAMSGEGRSLEMAEATLAAMASGGLCDQIGGGFHRYSTDERWHVPHFEKMLYDQALLSRTYLEAFQLTRNPVYEKTARETLDYVLRALTHPDGAFYSAEDADSAPDAGRPGEKSEGAFYVWTAAEIRSVLAPDEALLAEVFWGIEQDGNVREDPHGEFQGANVLYQACRPEEAAARLEMPLRLFLEKAEAVRAKLFDAREKRPKPHLDDKVLTDWNALMASSFALAGRVLREPRYVLAARRCLDFLLTHLVDPEGNLFHRWREGERAVGAFLDDHVFLIGALTDFYETVFEARYLEEARRLAGCLRTLFLDENAGGFFFTPKGGENLFNRQKPVYDGALPSGNSASAAVLARLSRLLRDPSIEKLARETLEAFSGLINAHPSGYPAALSGLDFLAGPVTEIVAAGPRGHALVEEALALSGSLFSNRVVTLHQPVEGPEAERLNALIPGLEQLRPAGEAAVFFCRDFTCSRPVETAAELARALETLKGKNVWI